MSGDLQSEGFIVGRGRLRCDAGGSFQQFAFLEDRAGADEGDQMRCARTWTTVRLDVPERIRANQTERVATNAPTKNCPITDLLSTDRVFRCAIASQQRDTLKLMDNI